MNAVYVSVSDKNKKEAASNSSVDFPGYAGFVLFGLQIDIFSRSSMFLKQS